MNEFQPSWTMIAIYSVLMLMVGVWAARKKVSTVEDMAIAGRASGVWLVAFSVAATWINGVTLLGISGLGKDFGLSAYWSGGAAVLATIWMGFYVIPKLRSTNVITIPQLFDRYFGPRYRLVSMILVILRDLGATAGTIGSLVIITTSLLRVSFLEALALTVILTTLYVFLGGMWAVLVTDAIQFFIILAGSIGLLVLSFQYAGSAGLNRLDANFLDLFGPGGLSQSVAWICIGLAISGSYQTMIQRGLAASSSETARKGFLYGGIICSVWYMVPPLIGLLGHAALGAGVSGDQVFLQMTFQAGGPAFASIVVISILAASMSTLSAVINTIASNFSVDIYQRFINPSAGPRAKLWVYRLNVALVGLLGALIYYLFPVLIELFWIGGRITGTAIAPVLIGLVLFPSVRRAPRTVLVSMLTGASSIVIAQFLSSVQEVGPIVVIWSLDPILVGMPLTILVLVAGTYWETRRRVRPTEMPTSAGTA